MKRLIYLLTFVLLASLTLAFLPQPLAGTVTMEGLPVPEGLSLTQTNLRTGMEVPAKVDSNGYFLVDWSNHPFFDGDKIKITIDACESRPECQKTVTLVSGVPSDLVNFEISPGGVDEPNVIYDTIKETVYTYVCWDGSQKASASQCPAQPVPPIICEDGTEVENKEDCEKHSSSWWKWLISFVSGILVLLAGKSGWKFYNGKFQHYHRGIKSYHDPSTEHLNRKYRHTTWDESPIQCMKDVGKIQEGIDLSQE